MPQYAYSIVYRAEDKKMYHALETCLAVSKAECKDFATDWFEEEYPNGELLSLKIVEFVQEEVAPEVSEDTAQLGSTFSDYVKPEFSFKQKF